LSCKNIGSSFFKFPVRKFFPFILVAIVSISVGANAYISGARYPMPSTGLLLPDEETALSALMAYIDPEENRSSDLPSGKLAPLPVSIAITSYTVRNGDTLEKIAKRFGLRQDSIISINNLQSQGAIKAGIQLRIPNIDGVNHRVKRGENLSTIAKTYGQDMLRIVDANDLASSTISAGQNLFIPNARLASATLRDFYGERFVWPVRGSISSPFGYRTHPFTGLRSFHSAIDIVIPTGTRVKSTSDGKIADTGYNSVFGHYVIIKHDNGYQSLYAHLSSIGVRKGTSVAQGAAIGLSGNSGQSTGPHLHFSIFKNGQALDPRKLVK
jgi:murein DD-endopeptidase MepM/ murein hydrolase activator NlpD